MEKKEREHWHRRLDDLMEDYWGDQDVDKFPNTEVLIYELVQEEIDRAREELLGKLSKELVVGIKEIQEKEEQYRSLESIHIEIDDLIVEKIGGELKEHYEKEGGRWGWYS